MTIDFPVVVSFIGSTGFFAFTVKLRHFKVSEKPPASRATLSIEERQQEIRLVAVSNWATTPCLGSGASTPGAMLSSMV
jgi:hypothetical protein